MAFFHVIRHIAFVTPSSANSHQKRPLFIWEPVSTVRSQDAGISAYWPSRTHRSGPAVSAWKGEALASAKAGNKTRFPSAPLPQRHAGAAGGVELLGDALDALGGGGKRRGDGGLHGFGAVGIERAGVLDGGDFVLEALDA